MRIYRYGAQHDCGEYGHKIGGHCYVGGRRGYNLVRGQVYMACPPGLEYRDIILDPVVGLSASAVIDLVAGNPGAWDSLQAAVAAEETRVSRAAVAAGYR